MAEVRAGLSLSTALNGAVGITCSNLSELEDAKFLPITAHLRTTYSIYIFFVSTPPLTCQGFFFFLLCSKSNHQLT